MKTSGFYNMLNPEMWASWKRADETGRQVKEKIGRMYEMRENNLAGLGDYRDNLSKNYTDKYGRPSDSRPNPVPNPVLNREMMADDAGSSAGSSDITQISNTELRNAMLSQDETYDDETMSLSSSRVQDADRNDVSYYGEDDVSSLSFSEMIDDVNYNIHRLNREYIVKKDIGKQEYTNQIIKEKKIFVEKWKETRAILVNRQKALSDTIQYMMTVANDSSTRIELGKMMDREAYINKMISIGDELTNNIYKPQRADGIILPDFTLTKEEIDNAVKEYYKDRDVSEEEKRRTIFRDYENQRNGIRAPYTNIFNFKPKSLSVNANASRQNYNRPGPYVLTVNQFEPKNDILASTSDKDIEEPEEILNRLNNEMTPEELLEDAENVEQVEVSPDRLTLQISTNNEIINIKQDSDRKNKIEAELNNNIITNKGQLPNKPIDVGVLFRNTTGVPYYILGGVNKPHKVYVADDGFIIDGEPDATIPTMDGPQRVKGKKILIAENTPGLLKLLSLSTKRLVKAYKNITNEDIITYNNIMSELGLNNAGSKRRKIVKTIANIITKQVHTDKMVSMMEEIETKKKKKGDGKGKEKETKKYERLPDDFNGEGLKYYNNYDDLIKRLDILMAGRGAGNDSVEVRNEMADILDNLLKGKIITKKQYNNMYKAII